MKTIFKLIIPLLILFSPLLSKADYIDTLWGQTYNYLKTFSYTGSVINETETFTGQLYVKDISCLNNNDLTNYNNVIQFSVFSSLITWFSEENKNRYIRSNKYEYITTNVNEFFSWSINLTYRVNTNSFSLNPSYTWSYLWTICTINWVLFPNWIPNMNNDMPIPEIVQGYTLSIINILLVILLYLSPFILSFLLAKRNFLKINQKKENE